MHNTVLSKTIGKQWAYWRSVSVVESLYRRGETVLVFRIKIVTVNMTYKLNKVDLDCADKVKSYTEGDHKQKIG